MKNECFDQHLENLIFASIWLIVSFSWNLLTFVVNRKHSVVLHCVISILILIKITPAFSMLICYLKSFYSWLYWTAYACIGVIEVINFVADIGIFFFISIGMGVCDLSQVRFKIKPMIFLIGLSYIISALIYIFNTFGTFLSIFFFQIIYLGFLSSTLFTVSIVRDKNSAASSKQIKILSQVTGYVFMYCQFTSGYSCILFINQYFNFEIRYLSLWKKGIQFLTLIKILYIIRSRLKAGYTHDFLQEPQSIRPGILQASLNFSDYPISPPGCLIINPDYPNNLAFGYLL